MTITIQNILTDEIKTVTGGMWEVATLLKMPRDQVYNLLRGRTIRAWKLIDNERV